MDAGQSAGAGSGDGGDGAAAAAANNDAANNGAGAGQGDGGAGAGDGGQGGQGDQGNQGGQSGAPSKGNNLETLDVEGLLARGEAANNDKGAGNGSGDGGAGNGSGDGGAGGNGSGDGGQGGQGGQDGAAQGDAGTQNNNGAGAGQGQGDGSGAGEGDGTQGNGQDGGELPDWKTITPQSTDLVNVTADAKYGIEPITEIPEPADGQKWGDYVNKELMPRMVQAVNNLVGLRQKSFDAGEAKTQQATQQADQERADGWVNAIDGLVKDKSIPAYTLGADGKLDMNSEGGKVIGQVFEYMNKMNENKPDNQRIYDFNVAHRLWAADKAEADRKAAEQQQNNTRRQQAGRQAGSTQNNNSRPQAGSGVRKGMTLDDIEID